MNKTKNYLPTNEELSGKSVEEIKEALLYRLKNSPTPKIAATFEFTQQSIDDYLAMDCETLGAAFRVLLQYQQSLHTNDLNTNQR